MIAKNDWIQQIARNTTENFTAKPAMDEDLVPKEWDLALVQVPCPWILELKLKVEKPWRKFLGHYKTRKWRKTRKC